MPSDERRTTKDEGRRSRRLWLVFLVCSTGLIATLFALTLTDGRWRQRVRGIGPALPEPIAHAAVSPLCVNVALRDAADLSPTLDRIAEGGFVWVRQIFPWRDIEPVRERFDWAPWDRLVRAVTEHPAGLQLIAVLDTAPAWASGAAAGPWDATPPADPAELARFAGQLAARYGDRIDYYQIWDEPNLSSHWGGRDADPAGYAALLQAAAEAIRAADADGEAVILLAGLAPTVETGPRNLSDVRFLRALYELNAAPYFDVVAGKPYGFYSGPDDRRVSESVLNFSRLILLRETMVAHGDGHKAVWASHWGWNALPAQWDGPPSLWGQTDAETQAVYTVAALERVRREWPWAGGLCLENWQPDTPPNNPRWGFALLGQDGAPRPVYQAIKDWADGLPANPPGYYAASEGLAEYSGEWHFSELGADVSESGEHRVTIRFDGADFGLRVRRGDYRAYMFVAIDGRPANALPRDENGAYLVLTSPDGLPQVSTIAVARGLPDGPHVAEVRVERGWGQWPLVGWSVGWRPHAEQRAYEFRTTALALSLLCAAGAVGSAWRMRRGWSTRLLAAAWQGLSDAAHIAIAATVTLVFWASAWLTWGQERAAGNAGVLATLASATLFYVSPVFLLSLAGLAGLGILIVLRLDLGLALVAFAAPFYLQSRAMFDQALSVVEIALALCVASWLVGLGRRTNDEGRIAFHVSRLTFHVSRLTFHASRFTLDHAVLFFVAVSAASLLVAEFQGVALREFRIVVLEPALYYLMLRTVRLDWRARWRIVDAFVLGAVGVALVGLYQYLFTADIITAEAGLRRLKSVYGSPNNVGLYLGRALPLLIAIPLWGADRRRCTLYAAAALPVAAAILLSFSKGALLFGAPAALLALGLLAGGRWLWAALGAVIAGVLTAVPLLRTPRFTSLFDLQSGTSFFRLHLWRSAVDMMRDHPILGVGLDNFLYAYRGRYIRPAAWQEPDLSHPHNIVLDYGSRLGVLGFAAGLWLQAAFWRLALPLRRLPHRDERALALGLMAGMVDFLAHGLVDNSYFLVDLAFAFFLTLALIVRLSETKDE
jgi:O-antigen ligase